MKTLSDGCTPIEFCVGYLRDIAKVGALYDNGFGICYNLTQAIRAKGYASMCSGYTVVQKYASLWPEFSGDLEYPVPCDMYEVDGQRVGYAENDLWVGEYGAARRRLAGFIADCLEEELKA